MAKLSGLGPPKARRIKGQPPNFLPTTQKDALTFITHADGRTIIRKRRPKLPKKHIPGLRIIGTPGPHITTSTNPGATSAVAPINGNLAPINQQQVATWDATLACLKIVSPFEWQAANALTGGTAFYTRDLLLMAAYGHLISWPGWGPFYDGPNTPAYPGQPPGRGYIPPVPLGSPQPTNIITQITVDLTRPEFPQYTVKTCRPANNLSMVIFGIQTGAPPYAKPAQLQTIPTLTKRGGQLVPHGPCQFYLNFGNQEDFLRVDDYTWTNIDEGIINFPGILERIFCFVEFGQPPVLNWTSQAHPFPYIID